MYVAVFSAFTGIAGFLGPLCGGWLYEEAAGGPAWIQTYGLTAFAGAVLILLALVVAPMVFRERRKAQGETLSM